MIVAVATVRVMQVSIDEVVDMVAVRHRRMTTGRAVHVISRVSAAAMPRRAARRIRCVNGDRALVDVIAVHCVKVSIVKVVDMTVVLDRDVSAVRAVDVFVVRMRAMRAHPEFLSSRQNEQLRKRCRCAA